MEKKNSIHIQILRGLAIAAVVLIHNTPQGYYQVFIRPFLNFSVGMFLFLSGILSNAQNWKPGKRIKKVFIPYVIWTFIYVALNNIFAPTAIPRLFIKNLITADAASMLYYIFLYCEFTLLIPVIDKLAKSKYRNLGFFITPLEILFLRTIPLVTQWYALPDWLVAIRGNSCLGWFIYFYLGYLIGNNMITIDYFSPKWVWLLAASLPLQMLEGWWRLSLGIVNCGTQTKLSTVFTNVCVTIVACRFIQSQKTYRNKILEMLGDNSFAIYFAHVAVMWFLEMLPFYSRIAVYPMKAIVVLTVNLLFIFIGKRIFGKYGKYLAL